MKRNSSGWVIQRSHLLRSGRRLTTYWLGPDRSWGHSFGSLVDEKTATLSFSVATFPTRTAAREAMAVVGLRGCNPVALDVALDLEIEVQAS